MVMMAMYLGLKKMFKNLFYLISLIAFFSCAPPQELYDETSYEETLIGEFNSKWSGHDNAFPLNVKISGDFSNDENIAINEVANNWSAPFVDKNMQVFNLESDQNKNSISDLNNFNDNTLGIYKIYDWNSELPPTALAVTQIYGNQVGNEIIIYHADILVNYDNFSFSDDFGYGHDLQTVIAHEMGHFLGLYHDYSSVDESIMYPSITRFTINRAPKEKDIENIKSKYRLHSTQSTKSYVVGEQVSKPVLIRQYLFANGDCKHSIGEHHEH